MLITVWPSVVMPIVIIPNVEAPRRRVSELGAFGIKAGQTVWTALKIFSFFMKIS